MYHLFRLPSTSTMWLTMGRFSAVEKFLTQKTLQELCKHMKYKYDMCEFKVYLRALIRKEVYHCREYLRAKKQNNYTVMYRTNGSSFFGEVNLFLWLKHDRSEPSLLAMLTPFEKCADVSYSHTEEIDDHLKERIIPIKKLSHENVCINASDIVEKCIAISIEFQNYIVKFPNDLSRID